MGVVGELIRRLREPSQAARAAEMQAAIRRMFAGRPHNCESLLTQPAEGSANPRAAGDTMRNSGGEGTGTRAHIVRSFQLAAFASVLIAPMIARAGIMTIDFPGDVVPSTTVGHDNALADGFRISPSSEYTLVASGGSAHGVIDHGIGWDSDGPSNPHYLGSPTSGGSSLFVDDGGAQFSLLSATFIAQLADDNFKVLSSKGGVFDIPSDLLGTFDASFGGPQWTDISWLSFSYFDAGAPTAGLDRLVLAVGEPGTLAIFAIGLVVLCCAGRQRSPRLASTARAARF